MSVNSALVFVFSCLQEQLSLWRTSGQPCVSRFLFEMRELVNMDILCRAFQLSGKPRVGFSGGFWYSKLSADMLPGSSLSLEMLYCRADRPPAVSSSLLILSD